MQNQDDITTNAGRCDWCGETVDMRDAGDKLYVADERDFGNEAAGITANEAVDAIADALERDEDPRNDSLAESLRKEMGYILHGRCWEESGMSDMPTEEDF